MLTKCFARGPRLYVLRPTSSLRAIYPRTTRIHVGVFQELPTPTMVVMAEFHQRLSKTPFRVVAFIVVWQSTTEHQPGGRRCTGCSTRYTGWPSSSPHLRVLAALQTQIRHDLVNSLFALCLRHVRSVHLAREQQILANCRKQSVGG